MTYVPEGQEIKSAFGDNLSSRIKPISAVKATYGITGQAETFKSGTGTLTTADGNFVLSTGTTTNSYATLWTRQPIVYQPGIGVEARGTVAFTTGVSNSTQGWGLFSAVDGMIVGYNGVNFGVMHRYGGDFEIRTLQVTNPAGGTETLTVTLNGLTYTMTISGTTVTTCAHSITAALEANAIAAAQWNIQHINDTVVLAYKGDGEQAGAYSTTASGTLATTFTRTKAGVDSTESWTVQGSWNRDTCSWLDPTKANLYKVEFAYLGYGPLNYYVRNPSTDQWVLFHQVDWGNAYTRPNFTNPSMRAGWFSASLGSTTNLTVIGANTATYLQGDRFQGRPFGASNTKSISTEQVVLSVQVRREFGARSNNSVVIPVRASCSTVSSQGAIFRIYRNPTVAGVSVHQYVDQTESCCTYDTAGTTVSGGRILAATAVGASGNTVFNLDDIGITLVAGDELVITAQVTSGAAANMTVALTWDEII